MSAPVVLPRGQPAPSVHQVGPHAHQLGLVVAEGGQGQVAAGAAQLPIPRRLVPCSALPGLARQFLRYVSFAAIRN
jgi:hypothetical protein